MRGENEEALIEVLPRGLSRKRQSNTSTGNAQPPHPPKPETHIIKRRTPGPVGNQRKGGLTRNRYKYPEQPGEDGCQARGYSLFFNPLFGNFSSTTAQLVSKRFYLSFLCSSIFIHILLARALAVSLWLGSVFPQKTESPYNTWQEH